MENEDLGLRIFRSTACGTDGSQRIDFPLQCNLSFDLLVFIVLLLSINKDIILLSLKRSCVRENLILGTHTDAFGFGR